MKSCFFCSTPFHVLIAMAITVSEKMESDIFVFDEFADCDSVVKRLKKTGIFKRVKKLPYTIDPKKCDTLTSKAMLYMKVFKLYMQTEKIVPVIIKNKKYDRLYVFHLNNCYLRMICSYFLEHFPETKMYFYEDGISSYSDPILYENNFFTIIMQKLLFGKAVFKEQFSIAVFSPELYKSCYNNNTPVKNIIGITKLGEIEGFRDLISSVFTVHNDTAFQEKFLLFDTVRKDEFTEEGSDKFQKVIDEITEKYPNTVIKNHPRVPDYNKGYNRFLEAAIPLEYYCYSNDFNNKILISSFSGAVFTPKLLFDQEPYIIFLFEILKDCFKMPVDREKMYINFRSIYRDKDKVLVPKSMEELNQILDKLNIS